MIKGFLLDLACLALAAAIALLATQGSIDLSCGGVNIDSDLQTYAQSLARDRFPESFANDPAMHIKDNASLIPNIETTLGGILAPDAPAIGLLRAGGVIVFLFYALWFLFGRWLLGSRTLATTLALLSGITVWIGWGTFWGILHSDPLPRSLYAALWPLLIMLGAYACLYPRLRPLAMLAAGLSIWVHGVSALCTGAMLACAFAFCKDSRHSLAGHVTTLATSVATFLVPVCIYLRSTFFADVPISSEEQQIIQTVFHTRWAKDYSSNMQTILDMLRFDNAIPYIFLAGLACAFANLRSANRRIVLLTKLYFAFLAGILATFAISVAESWLAARLHRIPLGHELVRGVRFIIPLSLIMLVCTLHSYWNRVPNALRVALPAVLAFCLFGFAPDKQCLALQHALSSALRIELPLAEKARQEKAEAELEHEAVLQAARITKQGEQVFTPDEVLALRYVALRPVTYTFKEGYIFYYRKDVAGMRQWLAWLDMIKASKDGYLKAWRQSPARVLLCRIPADMGEIQPYGDIVWKNRKWLLAVPR